jgi:hypothetical protein
MTRHRRRVVLIAVIVVVVVAAAVTAVLLLHRGKSGGVHYLTSTAATATIAETVQADFTLASSRDAMTISLSGTGSPSSSSSTGTPATTTRIVTTATRVVTRAAPADDTPSPSPSATTPTLTSFSPVSGPVGATVTLTGAGFDGATAVGFDGRPANVFKVLSDTQLTVTVPPGALSGLIVVTTPAGTAVSAMPFTVTGKRSPQPTPSPSATRRGGGSGSGSGGSTSSGTRSFSSGTGSSASSSTSASSSASSSTATSVGVVTGIAMAAGETPRTLQRLLTVSGKPIYAFVSAAPLYTTLSSSLSSGAQRSNVATLQHALKKAGYFSGTVNGVFGTTTTTALKDWQAAHGLAKTGTITTSRFVWVPKGAVLESWNVVLGGSVSTTTALATVEFPRELIAQALVTQADVASLKVGQKASLAIDGITGDAFSATITSIASQAASSSSSGSASSTVEYTVDLAPQALPALAKSGMTGSLTVTIASRSGVLVVPTSAVSGSSSSSFVRVMMNGVPAYRQVTTGLASSSLTQITSGLAAGETVVTGQYTNASAAANSSTSGGFGGFSGFPGGSGGFQRRSSSGSTTPIGGAP